MLSFTEPPLIERPSQLLLPLGFLLTFFVGRALPCRDFVEGAPLRFHPHVE
jgi:hypothetical protein